MTPEERGFPPAYLCPSCLGLRLTAACSNHKQSLRHLPVDFTPTVGCHSEGGQYLDISLGIGMTGLVEWIGSSTPVGEEETETNCLKET
jgi:hypothetical protein